MFIGRDREVSRLNDFFNRQTAGLAVCSGRRRIGKSTLIEHVGGLHTFFEFYGLAPRENMSNQTQLDHFAEQLGLAFKVPPFKLESWFSAFTALSEMLSKLPGTGKVVVLLDEISWMANKDKDFVGVLKGVWDTKFKKNDRLILILCGSVSSWIEKNILNDKGFMGRISLTIHLEEMSLCDANKFWAPYPYISPFEKFKILSITGGVPRYLEEIRPTETAEQNIKRLCFSPDGILVTEFDKIFQDTFAKQAKDFKEIVTSLSEGSLDMGALCENLGADPSGAMSEKLTVLEQSGFISRDYAWVGGKKKKHLSRFRLKDNYLRFYLKYIEPKRDLIDSDLYHDLDLESLPGWSSTMGLQFENLVLNNLPYLQSKLGIPSSALLSASPYFQKTTKRKKGCQIDLLIESRHTLYVCEIKFGKKIGRSVISEVAEKIEALDFSKTTSVRPVLIYQGELSPSVVSEHFFSHLIPFDQFLY